MPARHRERREIGGAGLVSGEAANRETTHRDGSYAKIFAASLSSLKRKARTWASGRKMRNRAEVSASDRDESGRSLRREAFGVSQRRFRSIYGIRVLAFER